MKLYFQCLKNERYFVAENLKFDKQLTKCPYHTDLSLFAFVFSCVSYRD